LISDRQVRADEEKVAFANFWLAGAEAGRRCSCKQLRQDQAVFNGRAGSSSTLFGQELGPLLARG